MLQQMQQQQQAVLHLDSQSKYHEISRQLTPVESYGDESLVHMKTIAVQKDEDFKNSVLESFYSEGMDEFIPDDFTSVTKGSISRSMSKRQKTMMQSQMTTKLN